MLEERLTLAVENHPILYDKKLSNYKSATGRENAWKEVCKDMESRGEFKSLDAETLKKRWRTLRDAFIKHYRAAKLPKSGSAGGKKKKWIYYDQMLFLIPFIEFKETIGSYSQIEPQDFTDEEDSLVDNNDQTINLEEPDVSRTQNIDSIQDTDSTQDRDSTRGRESIQDTESSQRRYKNIQDTYRSSEAGLATTSKPVASDNRQAPVDQNYLGKSNTKGSCRKSKRSATDDQLMEIITKPDDPDELFMLSCVPTLKRLTPRLNMLPKMRIQQVLFDLQFGDMDTYENRPSTRASAQSTSTEASVYNPQIYSSSLLDDSYHTPCNNTFPNITML